MVTSMNGPAPETGAGPSPCLEPVHREPRRHLAEIADRAGLTKSTFFRHFADKREVLFGGHDMLARWGAPENSQPFAEIARAALRELQASATTLGAETGVRA